MHLVMALIPGSLAVATLVTCAVWRHQGCGNAFGHAEAAFLDVMLFMGIQILAIVRLHIRPQRLYQ